MPVLPLLPMESNLAPHLTTLSHHVLSLSMIGALDPIESPTVSGLWDFYTLTRRPSACTFFSLCISGAFDLWCHDGGEHSWGLVAMTGWAAFEGEKCSPQEH